MNSLLVVAAFSTIGSVRAVTILNDGDVDIGIAYEDDAWDLHVHNHSAGIEYDPADALLQILPAAQTTVPSDPAYSFLGTAGAAIWQLPQAEQPGLLALGIGSEEIEAGTFLGDHFTLTLSGVSGPGDFFLYSVDGFGAVTPYFNTRDGITVADTITLSTVGHDHFFCALSTPLDY
ncbi:MAG: choice-of-anchor M domain-containing protein [Chthoniobacterales bacterium]